MQQSSMDLIALAASREWSPNHSSGAPAAASTPQLPVASRVSRLCDSQRSLALGEESSPGKAEIELAYLLPIISCNNVFITIQSRVHALGSNLIPVRCITSSS